MTYIHEQISSEGKVKTSDSKSCSKHRISQINKIPMCRKLGVKIRMSDNMKKKRNVRIKI